MIVLPFPSALLSGHAKGKSFWPKAEATAKHRKWAKDATKAAKIAAPPGDGDIRIHIMFYPADRRGDRINFPNRMKPYFDGIAEALGVNDKRFLPVYQFAEPVKDARVVVTIGDDANRLIRTQSPFPAESGGA